MSAPPTYPLEPRPARAERHFPALRLARGAKSAMDGRKMLLAAAGLVLLWAGWSGLDRVFGAEVGFGARVEPTSRPEASSGMVQAALLAASEPFRLPVAPFVAAFAGRPGLAAFVHAVLAAAWAVAVWGILGGAIARIAAVEQATGDRIGIATATRFALGHAVGLVGSPLCPMIGVGFFAALCAPIGLLYRIPGATGPTIAGLIAFLPLLAGLVMALILAGLAVGWPLMVATVAVEGEDAFDALSRTYSYVYGRPGRFLLYGLAAWGIGAAGLVVVWAFAALTVHMARWGLSLGGSAESVGAYFRGDPAVTGAPTTIHAFWIYAVSLLARAWSYGYFYTASVLIYALLRRDVDGASYHDLGGLAPLADPFGAVPEEGDRHAAEKAVDSPRGPQGSPSEVESES